MNAPTPKKAQRKKSKKKGPSGPRWFSHPAFWTLLRLGAELLCWCDLDDK